MTYPEKAEEYIAVIGARLRRRFPMCDIDDIKQELRLWCLNNTADVSELLDEYQEPEDFKKSTRRLGAILRREAERYCRKEKAAKAGYRTSDEAFYSRKLLHEVLLPAYFDSGITEHPPVSREASAQRASGLDSETGTWTASLIDVDRALRTLRPGQKRLLYRVYRDLSGYTYAEAASRLGWTEGQLEGRLRRALSALQDALGGVNPWGRGPGARRVVSNVQAQAMTQDQ